MKTNKVYKIKNRKIKKKLKKCALGLLMFVLAAGFAATVNSTLARAGDDRDKMAEGYNGSNQFKYYKCILLEPGDTLWGIASEYKDIHISTQDYVDELMKINGLTSDRIYSGRFLTVTYYEQRE